MKDRDLEQQLRDSGADRNEAAELGRVAEELRALEQVKRDPAARAATYQAVTDRPYRRLFGLPLGRAMAAALLAALIVVPSAFAVGHGNPFTPVQRAFDRLTGKGRPTPAPTTAPRESTEASGSSGIGGSQSGSSIPAAPQAPLTGQPQRTIDQHQLNYGQNPVEHAVQHLDEATKKSLGL